MDLYELNDKQLNRLSEYLSNFSLIIIASLVLPNIFGVDKLNMTELQTFYLITAIGLLAISILVFPTLWKRTQRDSSKKSADHRIRK